ncbi:MAG: hypothetical protein ACYDER_29350 [Ktedonobacteraceae bacterium]
MATIVGTALASPPWPVCLVLVTFYPTLHVGTALASPPWPVCGCCPGD